VIFCLFEILLLNDLGCLWIEKLRNVREDFGLFDEDLLRPEEWESDKIRIGGQEMVSVEFKKIFQDHSAKAFLNVLSAWVFLVGNTKPRRVTRFGCINRTFIFLPVFCSTKVSTSSVERKERGSLPNRFLKMFPAMDGSSRRDFMLNPRKGKNLIKLLNNYALYIKWGAAVNPFLRRNRA